MSDLRAMVTSLLHALRHAGGEREVAQFEAEFERRGWELELGDQLTVLAAVQRAAERAALAGAAAESTESTVHPTATAATVVDLTPPPPRFALLSSLGPWVETLPAKWKFLAAVHELFESSDRTQLQAALSEVFVEQLGYRASRLDDTPRLANQKTLTHASVVARHQQFSIVIVESNYAGPHLSSYELIFTLHPRALVFALEPGARVRVVSRHTAAAAHQLGSRVLHGRGKRSFPTDDPVVWARRLALLEPRPEDDARSLAQRAHDLLAASAADLCADWDAQPVNPARLPGRPWDSSADLEVEQFLQPDPQTRRLHLGLEAELCASFPWRSRDGFQVDYVGYQVDSIHRDAAAAIRRKGSTHVVISLELAHVTAGGEPVSFSVPFSIVVPDGRGLFVVFGRVLAFYPKEQAHVTWESEDDAQSEQVETEDGDELDGDGEDTEEDEDDWSGPQEYAHPSAYSNAGFVPLLRWAVGRRLRWYGWNFAKARPPYPFTVQAFKAWIGRWRDEHGATRCSSYPVLNHHLQPPRVGLRVLPVDREAPPPPWACLDLSSRLPAGFAYPVAGARLGPGGVLAAPTLTDAGSVQLLTRAAEATSSNPRVRGPGNDETRTAFIAAPLARWSGLTVGALEDPLSAIAEPLEGQFLRCPGPSLRVLLPLSEGQRPVQCTWHTDIPAHADLDGAPVILVEVGQTIEVGERLVRTPPHTWGNDPEQRPHRLMEITDEIARGSAADSSLHIYAPPSLRGRLTRVDLVEVRDADGTLLAHRVSFESITTETVDRALLPDGRVALVELVGPEELPWDGHSDKLASGLVIDSRVEAPECPGGSADDQEQSRWLAGATGEPLAVFDILGELTLISRRPVEPDPALRVRVIDNWGQPRADGDPQIAYTYLRWLQAAHPVAATQIYAVASEHVGVLPMATSAAQLAVACRTPLPFFAPETAEGDAATLGAYDPRRRAGHPRPWCDEQGSRGIWEWRCTCGRLRGSTLAGMSCAICLEPVSRERHPEMLHECPLAVAVIHPWRRSLVAALLGLTEDELRRIMQTEDCSELADLTAAALEAPHRSLHRRIAQTDDADLLTALLQQHAELDVALRHGLNLDDLWLTDLPVLSPRLLFDGYRLGAPDLLESPLTKHYRSITAVSELTSGRVEMLPQLRRAQWVELQRRVEQLFGSVEGAEPGTLAEYWSRVWPTLADGELALSVPGLVADATPDELARSWTCALWPGATLEGEDRAHHGVITPTGFLPLPPPPMCALDPRDARSWSERGAWTEFLEHHLTWLAAVLLGVDGHARARQAVRAVLVADLADYSTVGRVLLRELVRAMAPASGRPSKLLELMLGRVPLRLPRADQAASEAIEQRLAGLVDAGDAAAIVSARALGVILGGFWCGTPSTEYPSGWLWAHSEHDAPKDFLRMVPRLDDAAWRLWPDFDLMTDPLRALARGSVVQPRSPSVRAWFGLDAGELPVDIDWGEPRAPTEEPGPPASAAAEKSAPQVEGEVSTPTPVAPVDPDPPTPFAFAHEAVVVDVSLRAWLAAHPS
ncbi:hypothetical protein ENSA5_69990 [Enhygromyxa salina]|uniref:Uncharacterized protein n=1 Tax=Enhygromyxa salina TaxID=215803 RepID=A0A2S9XAK7_9BACT|nr:hypothetical protein [Enhygromyxa salina]PRP89892.1 hypothetical protein ENSA5_69990 [Enhygromyxa salina]